MTETDPSVALLQLAEEFAASLDARMNAAPHHVPPIVAEVRGGRRPRISVAPRLRDDPEGLVVPIPLHVDGKHWLNLRLEMFCVWDRPNSFLTLDQASIRLEAINTRAEPLWRYEYERHQVRNLPVAHLQIHAHRDEITFLMSRGSGERALQRVRQGAMPTLKKLHFPLGGHRFRPCLEDVLEAVIVEFGVDSTRRGWRAALREGRADWRRKQLAAAVRDSPRQAAEALRRLGWTVEPPADSADAEDLGRLSAL